MKSIGSKHFYATVCIVALAVLCTTLVSGFEGAAMTPDIPSEWAQDDVNTARAKGLIISEADRNYRSNISRRLFSALVVNLVEAVIGESVEVTVENPFEDTNETDVVKAYQLGIVKGVSATHFAPNDFINREQIAIMMMRGARKLDELKGSSYAHVSDLTTVTFADQNDISHWALGEVQNAFSKGIIRGVGGNRINPKGNTTVEQSILLINRLYDGFTDFLSFSGNSGTPANRPPQGLANPVSFSVSEQTPLTIAASQIAHDPDGDMVSIIRINGQTSDHNTLNGTASLTAGGECVYTSRDITVNVIDDFPVTISDGTNETHVNVRVNVIKALEILIRPSISSISISGTAALGETLRVGLIRYMGIPNPSPQLAFQWMRATSLNGTYTNIPGATTSSYVVTLDDVNKYLRLQVTASGSASGSKSSTGNGPISLFSGGNGDSLSSPYLITNAQQFMLFGPVGLNTSNTHYKLMSDIVLPRNKYFGLFLGHLDGNGHTVNIDINEVSGEMNGVGLFSKIGAMATIANLYVRGRINVPTEDYVGGIAGINLGIISYCSSIIVINAHSHVGSITGYNEGTVFGCRAYRSSISGNTNTGGLVGSNHRPHDVQGGVITRSYAQVDVSAISNVGGLVGWNEGTISNCYSAGKVEGSSNLGGLVGRNNGGFVSTSYYDKDVSGRSDTGKGFPRTTIKMQTISTYAGWNFMSTWSIQPGQYPDLR